MNLNEYQKLAQISARKDRSKKDVLINSAMGLCGESGEAIDYIKKHLFHDHPLEKEVLMKEMGDVLWYLADMAEALDVTLDEVASMNIEKLRKRYPEGFDSEKSINRKE